MQAPKVYRHILLLCTLGSVLVIARQFTPSQEPQELKTAVKVHVQNSRKPLSMMELADPQPAAVMAQPKRCARDTRQGGLTRADLLVVIPGSLDRFELAKASRVWRQGISTALIMDQSLHMLQDAGAVQQELDDNLEFWATSPDVPPNNPLTEKAGDFRAALAPFLANKTAAPGSYKWILYGDDDTFWFIDNVLAYLDQLDPDMPYLLSDNIWLKERTSGYWYFIHGGAGAIMSRGLMDLTTYERCQDFVNGAVPRMSGDAMFTLTVWHMTGTPPTDPGYGYYRPHVQMMDPGWLSGVRSQRGPEDQGTYDGGNDPVGVVKRFQQALHGGVDTQTREQLDNVLTVHFRGRYAAVDVTNLSPEHADQAIGTNNFKATVHLHRHMAHLFEQYINLC